MKASYPGTVTKVVLAGATGWAGSALARGILASEDLDLIGAVSRSAAGRGLGEVLGLGTAGPVVSATAREALSQRPDVFVEYTKPAVARDNILAALDAGAHVVVGTSGLDAGDYDLIGRAAEERRLGVLACGNFSVTAVLMMHFSQIAARWMQSWEVIDYAAASKVDAPSGTARELAERLGAIGPSHQPVSVADTHGEWETRGAAMGGTRVHSVRLPSYVISIESILAQDGERITLRHDAGTSPEPYVGGALLAIRSVGGLVGLHRGLDTVMDL